MRRITDVLKLFPYVFFPFKHKCLKNMCMLEFIVDVVGLIALLMNFFYSLFAIKSLI